MTPTLPWPSFTNADLMRAVFYLVEQEYETGQALPVTGGRRCSGERPAVA